MFKTGFSKVQTWRSCNKRYEYSVIRNLQAKAKAAAPLRGTILHAMLAAYDMKGQKAAKQVWVDYDEKYDKLFEEERELYGDNFMEDIWRIYRGYLRTYREDDWEVVTTEGLVQTQLTPKILFEGHYDLQVLSKRRHWLVDRKSHKVIPTAEERFSNSQLLLYAEAWNREHPRSDQVDGVIWDYIRTKAPTIPEVLKSGVALTRRKDLDTDVYTYRKAIRDNGFDEDAYTPYLRELENRDPDRFYLRVPLPIPSKEMTKIVVGEFIHSAEAIRTAKCFPRNMTYQCSRCEFFKLCQAELAGINAKFVERSNYEEREETRDLENA